MSGGECLECGSDDGTHYPQCSNEGGGAFGRVIRPAQILASEEESARTVVPVQGRDSQVNPAPCVAVGRKSHAQKDNYDMTCVRVRAHAGIIAKRIFYPSGCISEWVWSELNRRWLIISRWDQE